jgi:hypothetical protein
MSRLLLRPALLLSGLLLLSVLLIRAQPYDDGGLREFLTPPEDCPAPCFMGIRPGVTTVEEMQAILSHHPWVLPGLSDTSDYLGHHLYRWAWAETAPDWFARDLNSEVVVDDDDGRIISVVIESKIPWSDVLLVFGRPDVYYLSLDIESRPESPGEAYHFVSWYSRWNMQVSAPFMCYEDKDSSMYRWCVVVAYRAEPPELWHESYPGMTHCR